MSKQITNTAVIVDNKIAIPTKTAEFSDFNILKVDVGTTGEKGGDSGAGGRTYLSIKDLASTDLQVRINGNTFTEITQLEILLGGDAELRTFKQVLEFALQTLQEQTKTE